MTQLEQLTALAQVSSHHLSFLQAMHFYKRNEQPQSNRQMEILTSNHRSLTIPSTPHTILSLFPFTSPSSTHVSGTTMAQLPCARHTPS